ncbi:MAG TPA: cyclopropane-fatty-acyl-phospholipid synthase family protein [Burkholderiales bacterium]|nr:cyclopropane-fatty-acyl-phospholipid synthase family protein [Burkholderiales bacterium]
MFGSTVANLMSALGAGTGVCFRVEFADGSHFQNREATPAFTVKFRKRSAQLRTALQGHIGFLESYFDGDVDIDGDLGAAFHVGLDGGFDGGGKPIVWLRNQWHELRCSNRSIEQARINARFHYGLGTEFYDQWLDLPLRMYTCAYWKEGTQTVEQAQRNKVEDVCRKIRLARDETVIDIGCGFGGFMFHAHEAYGAKASGLNTTPEQVDWLDAEIRRQGLQDRLDVRLADFREVDRQYDKVVSIGVLEHAGRDQLAQVVKAHADFLKPGGLGMLHFIGHVGVRDTEYYIREHIFPGGWIPSLAQTIVEMENNGLEVVDIENRRRHYALTLDAWCERFDRNWEKIRALDPKKFDERFRRAWRTYLYSCAEMFRSTKLRTHLFQIVFSKPNITKDNYPMSRAFLYRD